MQLAASAPLGALRSHSKASVQVYRRQVAAKTQIIRALRAPSCAQEVCRLAFGNRLASRLPNQVDSGSHENTRFLNLNGPRGCSAPLGALRSHSKASVPVYRRPAAAKTQIIRALRAPSCAQGSVDLHLATDWPVVYRIKSTADPTQIQGF